MHEIWKIGEQLRTYSLTDVEISYLKHVHVNVSTTRKMVASNHYFFFIVIFGYRAVENSTSVLRPTTNENGAVNVASMLPQFQKC
jgi:hypothetical protein